MIIFFISLLIISLTGNLSGYAAEFPDWDGFPPKYSVRDIVECDGIVYGATPGGLFVYNPATWTYKSFHRNHGLVSNNLLCVGAASHSVFLGFESDGLWQFNPATEVITQILFPEYHFKTPANPNGIAVNDIVAKNDSILFIGHARGLDMLNLVTEELRTYSRLGTQFGEGIPVNEVKIEDGKLWVCTPEGLAVADADDQNLEFPERWKDYLYGTRKITSIILVHDEYENEIYLGSAGSGIAYYDDSRDTFFATLLNKAVINKFASALGKYWCAGDDGLYNKDVFFWKLVNNNNFKPLNAIYEGSGGRLWAGSAYEGLQCYTDSGYVYIPRESKLQTTTFYDIELTRNNSLWAATQKGDVVVNSAIQRLQGTTWSAVGGSWASQTVSLLIDSQERIWAGIWGFTESGVYLIEDNGAPEITDAVFTPVDPDKIVFRPTQNLQYVICNDMAEDSHGNIWVANFQDDPPRHAIEAVPTSGAVVFDGYPINRFIHYSPYDDGLPTATVMKICTDEDGWVWLGTATSGLIGLFVGDDPYDKSDTEIHVLTLTQGILSMKILAIARDNDGNIWVGSDGGLNRITKQSGHVLHVEDMNSLLETGMLVVNSIAVDRFNNKWIGTTGGLVKIDKNNNREIVYTMQNSGLYSDGIFSLKYDNVKDILWVGSGGGLNKFTVFGQTQETNNADIHVFPNPFEIWGYDSQVVFTNLKPGSAVRIFTFDGVLISRVVGQEQSGEKYSLSWNGRNFEGKFVGSGIYFITGVDTAGRKFTDKFAVVRR